MSDFRMPSLGADMEAGTVVEWKIHPGDAVKRGDIIVLVETEKGLIEVEVFENGVVESLVVSEGEKVPVGAVLATIRPEAAPVRPAPPKEVGKPELAPARAECEGKPLSASTARAEPVEARQPTHRARVSPLARRCAEDLGVDLSGVTGTGEGGAVTKADVERAAAGGVPTGEPVSTVAAAPARGAVSPAAGTDRQLAMRRAIAAAMAKSKREIPHYYLGTHIDMSRAMDWLAAENLKRPVPERLLPAVLLLRAVALGVREVPEMNGFWIDGAFQSGAGVHIGVAISLRQGGLVAPAIHDVDKKTPDEVMRDLLDLVKRARAGMFRSSEVADATITVTNLGDQGVESVFGIIYPPQVALVGFGRVAERPWATEGMLGVRPVMEASLSADHRASDGHRGGRFLSAIDRLLQEPEHL